MELKYLTIELKHMCLNQPISGYNLSVLTTVAGAAEVACCVFKVIFFSSLLLWLLHKHTHIYTHKLSIIQCDNKLLQHQ